MRLWEGEDGDWEHAQMVEEGLVDDEGEEIRVAQPPPAPRQARNAADLNHGIGVVEVHWNGNIQLFVEEGNRVFQEDLELDGERT
jgi:hypothetical protein